MMMGCYCWAGTRKHTMEEKVTKFNSEKGMYVRELRQARPMMATRADGYQLCADSAPQNPKPHTPQNATRRQIDAGVLSHRRNSLPAWDGAGRLDLAMGQHHSGVLALTSLGNHLGPSRGRGRRLHPTEKIYILIWSGSRGWRPFRRWRGSCGRCCWAYRAGGGLPPSDCGETPSVMWSKVGPYRARGHVLVCPVKCSQPCPPPTTFPLPDTSTMARDRLAAMRVSVDDLMHKLIAV
jgi:hypothetical protein